MSSAKTDQHIDWILEARQKQFFYSAGATARSRQIVSYARADALAWLSSSVLVLSNNGTMRPNSS